MTIGIPKDLAYYKYNTLWKYFFNYLGINLIISPKINKNILDNVLNKKNCAFIKIYEIQLYDLINKCDYILISNIISPKKCINFYHFYNDILNTFNNKIINFSIYNEEEKELLKIAKKLNISKKNAIEAYQYATKNL